MLLQIIRAILLIETVASIASGRPNTAFIALATLGLTYVPGKVARLVGVTLPNSFLTAIVAFIFMTLFLGEVGDFYERFWWWDTMLHFGSAVGFGLFGFLLIFTMFEGDSYAAPPVTIAFLSACVAMSVGAIWEIFEFAMDELFGLNMQKSGLRDTMGDLIVDLLGAMLAALAGYLYLKGRHLGGFTQAIDAFVRANRRLYRRLRDR